MGEQLKAANGKQHVFWGTLRPCPACGRCLCFGCHPEGPCVDDREQEAAACTCGHADKAAAA